MTSASISPGKGPSPTTPSVSVLMPVFNAERYLAEAIESILAQTFGDFEFLILDDGSTDGSPAILRRYAANDPRIRLMSRENAGIVASLNQMLGMARGELVARMDADDIASPVRLERQVAHLAEHPECVLVGSRVTIIDPDGSPLTIMDVPLEHEEIDQSLMAAKGQMIYHPAVVIRRRAVEQVGGYRVECNYAEDLDLFLRLAEVGRITNLAEPLLSYREHLGKVGHTRMGEQAGAIREALASAYRRRGLEKPTKTLESIERTSDPIARRRTWGWWALNSGHVATARKHAFATLLSEPFNSETWRLLYCALRG